jgi:hypothetical protein
MASAVRRFKRWPLAIILGALGATGCQLAPREQLEDCRRLSQTLRSENAKLKDETLALRSQNQDYAERAVDDGRRLAQLEKANGKLEASVVAYQQERGRLEAAVKELRVSLTDFPKTVAMDDGESEPIDDPSPKRVARNDVARNRGRGVDASVERADIIGDEPPSEVVNRPRTPRNGGDSWVPAGSGSSFTDP